MLNNSVACSTVVLVLVLVVALVLVLLLVPVLLLKTFQGRGPHGRRRLSKTYILKNMFIL